MKLNVCFVHPPSIYDFRKRELRPGPISDVVPSTPVFEMYPIGFLSMLSSLTVNGLDATICNTAVHMLASDRFDIRDFLRKIHSDIYALDLHWLPHAQGAYEISRIIRELHPNSKILLGGFSATYFRQEIMMEMPWVDYILAGDLQEQPIVDLSNAVESGKAVTDVNNLVYRDAGKIRENRRSNSPEDLKKLFINYEILAKNTLRHGDILGHMPYYGWLRNPEAFTLIEHGCQFNCGFCGGSNFAYSTNYGSTSPMFRDPSRVAEEMELVQDVIGSPVFIAGDLYAAGEKYYSKLFREIRERKIDIPVLTEYFVPPPPDYLSTLNSTIPEYSAEISPESSSERIRREAGKTYTNHDLEKSIEAASKSGCRKFDAYFTIGLPHQTEKDVMDDVRYTESLDSRFNRNGMDMRSFISPLTPFLDPGSLYYEYSEKYGIKILARKFMDYYWLLERGKSWRDFLNYETDTMSRADIEHATYTAGLMMIRKSARNGSISEENARSIAENIVSYTHGDTIPGKNNWGNHLTYLNKEIEWSTKHSVTGISPLVFIYMAYDSIARMLRIRN
jgi:B12-binding domain/radical SAM domain protein